ncbi:MAG: hypothetical protein ACXAB4_07505, partial [Candidatus Hodarchaeales archaeon]
MPSSKQCAFFQGGVRNLFQGIRGRTGCPARLREEWQTMASTPLKNRTTKATLAATKARRKTQVCRVYELKVNRSKINATSREHLDRLFLEAKWFYNWVL